MKKRLAIILNKLITILGKLIGKNASVFPASIALKVDSEILEKLKYPKIVVGVTGSSGKGSTTEMIAHILKNNGYKVVWNKEGSNVLNGTATLILNHTSLFKTRVKADVLLLEMDESFIRDTFKKSTLTHLVVTNITRDQPARNYSPEDVLNKVISSVDSDTHLILNVDDSLVGRMALSHEGKITSYGIGKTKYSLDKPLSNNIDGAYCLICNLKLEYSFYHYGHLGNYKCPGCDFKSKPDYVARDLDLSSGEFFVNGLRIKLNKKAFYAAYFSIAAFTLCKELGLDDIDIQRCFNIDTLKSKRMSSVKFDGRDVVMIESKNENNLSYLQSLNVINDYDDKKTIIVGFDNVSRRYKYNDLSWLYDVDFKVIDTTKVERIFCIGRFRFDVAARLVGEGIDSSKIFLVNDVDGITSLLKENTSGIIFTMVCFDMTERLKSIFSRYESGDEND